MEKVEAVQCTLATGCATGHAIQSHGEWLPLDADLDAVARALHHFAVLVLE